MKELHSQIEINASAQRVWRLLTDFASYPRMEPFHPQHQRPTRPRGALQHASSLPADGHDLQAQGPER